MEPVGDTAQREDLWRRFREQGNHRALESRLGNLSDYEKWKISLERGVGSFWTCQGERLAFLAAYQNGEPVGIVRVLKVPIYPWDRSDWGADGFRGEIQDLLYHRTSENAATELVKEAAALLKEKGLERIGASCWRPEQCEVFRQLGFRPFRRNIFLGWRTDYGLLVESGLKCKVHYVGPGEEKLVQEVFTSTWGFPVTFLPRTEIQQALVAVSDERPLGTVLMNIHSCSLDLGVQVVSSHRRKHIGGLLVQEALSYYRRNGFNHMYVIRNIPVNGLRKEDEVALQFYASTGAFPLREYIGLQSGESRLQG